jgi:hypothetical protein
MPELRRAKRGEGTSVASDDRMRNVGTLRNPEGFAEGLAVFPQAQSLHGFSCKRHDE